MKQSNFEIQTKIHLNEDLDFVQNLLSFLRIFFIINLQFDVIIALQSSALLTAEFRFFQPAIMDLQIFHRAMIDQIVISVEL